MNFKSHGKVVMVTLAACSALASCSGGGGGSTTAGASGAQQPVVAVGPIAAFGSVFVNGVEYDTSGSSFKINGTTASDGSALSVGMVVRVKGSRDGEGKGTATEIRYEEEIDGPAADVTVDAADSTIKHFTIFGQPITANATTVFRGPNGTSYTFADLANGDHVEVSGDYDGDTLIATFVKLKDPSDTTFEVKGTVSDLNGSTFVLTLHAGSTLNVTLADGASIPAGLQDGAFVEVKGTVPDATKPQDLLAQRVQIQDQDEFDGSGRGENEDEGELCGTLAFDGTTWSVRGTPLEFSADTTYRPDSLAAAIDDGSAAGLRVEVEGPVISGVLQVKRIRADGRADGVDELKAQGFVHTVTSDSSAGTTTIEMSFTPAEGTVDVVVDAQTVLMSDDRTASVDLSTLVPDVSFIRVRGHLDATGAFIASAMQVESGAQDYELRGPLDTDGFVADVSISVLGVKFMLNADTSFDGSTPTNGDSVNVEDRNRDGYADSIDVRNDSTDGSEFARPERDD